MQVVHVGAVRAARPVDLGVEHPAQVRPVEALVARVRVERRLGVQVVVAVVGDPLERPALCIASSRVLVEWIGCHALYYCYCYCYYYHYYHYYCCYCYYYCYYYSYYY